MSGVGLALAVVNVRDRAVQVETLLGKIAVCLVVRGQQGQFWLLLPLSYFGVAAMTGMCKTMSDPAVMCAALMQKVCLIQKNTGKGSVDDIIIIPPATLVSSQPLQPLGRISDLKLVVTVQTLNTGRTQSLSPCHVEHRLASSKLC